MRSAGSHVDLSRPPRIRIEPWGADDLGLLQKCLGDPVMMEHLGGPESPEKIAERHRSKHDDRANLPPYRRG